MTALGRPSITIRDRFDLAKTRSRIAWVSLGASLLVSLGFVLNPPQSLSDVVVIECFLVAAGPCLFIAFRLSGRRVCRLDQRGVTILANRRRQHMAWDAIDAVYFGGSCLRLRAERRMIRIGASCFAQEDWQLFFGATKQMLQAEFDVSPTDVEKRHQAVTNRSWWFKILELGLLGVVVAALFVGLLIVPMRAYASLLPVLGRSATNAVGMSVAAVAITVMFWTAQRFDHWHERQWRKRLLTHQQRSATSPPRESPADTTCRARLA